ncbi:MAG TPA: kelch repeat-containing protein [Myxococcaceae bacterium]|nr:kelch repeat-containing protein [Myxococcaceae bacterium]
MRRSPLALAIILIAGSSALLSCAPDPESEAGRERHGPSAIEQPAPWDDPSFAARPLPDPEPASVGIRSTGTSWTPALPMLTARGQFAAVLLTSGEVLVAGGVNRNGFVNSAELFDPLTGLWREVGSPGIQGNVTSGVLLPSGQALIVSDGSASGRVFDPATETWSATGPMAAPRLLPTTTVLSSGRVLIAGGSNLATAELYDPETATFTPTGSMSTPRRAHVATLLTDGRVLVTSGSSASGEVPVAELYNPSTGTWSLAAPPLVPRHYATATLLPDGRVLLAGGFTSGGPITQSELYDPAANTWTATGSLHHARSGHTATLLPTGKVLVVGGSDGARFPQGVSELYDPATGTWAASETLQTGRENHAAILLPTGEVLVAGGIALEPTTTFHAEAEVYAPPFLSPIPTPPLSEPRMARALLLPSGRVLLPGGIGEAGPTFRSDLFDPTSNVWAAGPSVLEPRAHATTTLLENGDVLVVGGEDAAGEPVRSVERFLFTEDRWAPAPWLAGGVSRHTASRLNDGSVLVVGGSSSEGSAHSATWRFVPAEGAWSEGPELLEGRSSHAAARLMDGSVLVAGGVNSAGTAIDSAEFLAAEASAWVAVSPLDSPRSGLTLTPLPDGRALAIGGSHGGGLTASAHLFDPTTGEWTETGPMTGARAGHTAIVLPTGKVWVAGGIGPAGLPAPGFEIWDPTTGTFTFVSDGSGSAYLTGVSLPSGRVLLAGTGDADGSRLYDNNGAQAAWRPVITGGTPLQVGCRARVSGTGFRGISEGASGSYLSTASNVPVVRLLDPETGGLWTLPATDVSPTGATVTVPATLRPGSYGLTVITQGIPGGRMVEVSANAAPTVEDGEVSVRRDTPTQVTLIGEDPEADPSLTWLIVSPPEHGTLSGTPPELTYTPNEGFLGDDSFTFVAEDCGLTSAPATVTLQVVEPDTTPPTLSCPADQTVPATGGKGATVTWPPITANDAEDPAPTVVTTPERGSVLPIGVTEVVATATDASGNSASCTFTVTVTEPEPLGCNCQASGVGGGGVGVLTVSAALLGWLHRRRRREAF